MVEGKKPRLNWWDAYLLTEEGPVFISDSKGVKRIEVDFAIGQLIAWLGNGGWEMVGAVPVHSSNVYYDHRLYFKRPKL